MLMSLITLAVAILSYLYWRRRDPKLPPGPIGVPILGALPLIGRHAGKRFKEWSQKYGEIFSVRLGDTDFVVITDFKHIEEVCLKQAGKVVGKPELYLVDHLRKGCGILFAKPSVWSVQRGFVAHSLRRLGMGTTVLEQRIQEEAASLIQAIREKDEAYFDLKPLTFLAAANIIFGMTIGERFDYKHKEFRNFIHHSTKMLQDPIDSVMVLLMLYCKWLHLIPPFRGVRNRATAIFQDVREFFQQRIEEHQSSFDHHDIRDITDAFLEKMNQENHNETFNKNQLEILCKDFVDAGTQTTSTTLMWCILVLLRFPEWQTKIRSEIELVLDMNGEITMEARECMPQTVAFIHEVMRRCCLVHLSNMRTLEEITLDRYRIPPNTSIIVNLWSVHFDPKYFENPEEFRPERFISKVDGKFTKPKYWVPFAIGKRSCVGEQLAQMEIFLLLVKMIQNFSIEAANEDELPTLDDGVPGSIYLPKPFKVRFVQS